MDLKKEDKRHSAARSVLIALTVLLALGLVSAILFQTLDLRQDHWVYSEQKDPFTDVVSARAELDSEPSSGHILLECTTGKPVVAIVESQYAGYENETGDLALRLRFAHEKPISVVVKGSARARFDEAFLRKLASAKTFAAQFEEPYVTYEPMMFDHLGGTKATIKRLKKACA